MKKIIFILFLALALSACSKNVLKDTEEELAIEYVGWEKYSEDGLSFRYARELAYKKDENIDALGYEKYIGFSDRGNVERNDAGVYPIEFAVVSEEKESQYVNGHKYISGFKQGNKFYYFATSDMAKYGATVDKMAESLEIE